MYDQSTFQPSYLGPSNPYLPPAYSMFSSDFGASRMLRTGSDQDQLLGIAIDSASGVTDKVDDNSDEKWVLIIKLIY